MNTKNAQKSIEMIGNKVKIKPLQIRGIIKAIYIDKFEITYQVQFYYNGEQKRLYFEVNDLEIIKDEQDNLGFNEK